MIYPRLITVVALLLLTHTVAMAIEEPSYEVIQTYEDFEVRRYQPYLVAEVDVSGAMDEAGSTAFRILAGYIFGDNQAATKMAMTAPVESRPIDRSQKMAMTAPVISTTAATEAQSTFAFVMERKYSMETLPVPNDERIRIREVPERIMAVRRYSGRWTNANYERNYEMLVRALSNTSLESVGEPVLARYNSPFTLPLMRRNEVMLQIEALPSRHSERVAQSYGK